MLVFFITVKLNLYEIDSGLFDAEILISNVFPKSSTGGVPDKEAEILVFCTKLNQSGFFTATIEIGSVPIILIS